MSDLPEATAKPCNECPWKRDSLPGHLGPLTPEEWVMLVHSDTPIACHKTIHSDGGWDTPGVRQCAGAGTHRTNTFKRPRNPEVFTSDKPDTEQVFARSTEFVAHHQSKEKA